MSNNQALIAQMIEMAGRWLHYGEAFVIGMLGAVARLSHLAVSSGELYTIGKIAALLITGGGVGFLAFALIPDAMPGKAAAMWCGGFLAHPILSSLVKNGPAWIKRMISGTGTPLDDDSEK